MKRCTGYLVRPFLNAQAAAPLLAAFLREELLARRATHGSIWLEGKVLA